MLTIPLISHFSMDSTDFNRINTNHQMGQVVNYISILTSVFLSLDMMVRAMTVRKVVPIDQYRKIGLVLWPPILWQFLANTAVTFLTNIKVGISLSVTLGIAYMVGLKLTPSSVHKNLAKNQIGL